MRQSLFLLGLPLALALPQGEFQEARLKVNKARADGVRDCFQFAWDGYYKYAFPNDELHPVSNSFGNTRNGWGASAVDALSTALVMKLPTVVDQILDHVATIDYTQTDDVVSLFETTIRYLGGMLSGYDLLKGPLKHLVDDEAKVDKLLEQSKNLADAMKFAFNTPSGIPVNNIYVTNGTTDGSTSNGLATTGTLVMEWTRLSDLLGNDEYAELAQKAEKYLLHPSSEAFPGLVGSNIAVSNGTFLDKTGGWNGGTDSFYEYLLKMWVYDSEKYGEYKDRWITAAESSQKYLASHPSSRPDITFLAAYNDKELNLVSQHLTCFDGGNFILGGVALGRQDLTDFGLQLVDGCHDTYIATVTGIGPEVFSWDEKNLPANQTAFYEKNGFWIEDGFYDLRPEVIESFYYAYRATKDPKYQDWAWEGFQNINRTARANSGFSSFTNVNIAGGGSKDDNQESFLFAEVMKYSYLIHAEDAPYQYLHKGKNDFVFNTEAHPFKVAGKKV